MRKVYFFTFHSVYPAAVYHVRLSICQIQITVTHFMLIKVQILGINSDYMNVTRDKKWKGVMSRMHPNDVLNEKYIWQNSWCAVVWLDEKQHMPTFGCTAHIIFWSWLLMHPDPWVNFQSESHLLSLWWAFKNISEKLKISPVINVGGIRTYVSYQTIECFTTRVN